MDYDRAKELKAFDDTKAGVKGLVDAGTVNIPRIFIRPSDELSQELNCFTGPFQFPVIDLSDIEKDDRRKDIVDEIRIASEKWGFFQVVNHGIPLSVLSEMMNGVRAFHEQPSEVKKEFYTRDRSKRVRLECNYDLYHSTTANWRDTLNIFTMMLSDHLDPDEVPVVLRDATIEYFKNVSKLGDTLFELLSEALGLKPGHLTDMECSKGRTITCHYSPACPEPDLTLASSRHSDPSFLAIVLQDQIGGLQILHENQWVDVQPIVGGLVINIGDLLQMISNNKFKSVDHRVVAKLVGPRISVACFFRGLIVSGKLYGPIEEMISTESPPLYRESLVDEFFKKFYTRPLGDKSVLDHFKL